MEIAKFSQALSLPALPPPPLMRDSFYIKFHRKVETRLLKVYTRRRVACFLFYNHIHLKAKLMRQSVSPEISYSFPRNRRFQVDLDADGILDRAQFKTLAKQTLLRRAKTRRGSTSLSHCGPQAVDRDPSWAVGEDGQHRDRDIRRRRKKGNIDDLAVELLKVSDPHGFGRITFSECVKCLAPRPAPASFANG